MKTRKIEDYTTMEIPGKNSWEIAKKNIWNIFYKGYLEDSKFVIEISNTNKSPGLYTIVNNKEKLSETLNFVEKNHIQEGRLFNFHFHNLYLIDVPKEDSYLIKETAKKGEYSLAI